MTDHSPERNQCPIQSALFSDSSADGLLLSPGPLGSSQHVEHAILHILERSGTLGSGGIWDKLAALGYPGSEPTVGRFLRALDRQKLTCRVSNRGRQVTPDGRQRLVELCEAADQLRYETELLRTLRVATIDDVLDVLVARRAIERETCRLAAINATEEDLAALAATIAEQRRTLRTTGLGIDADVRFHALIAQAARNRVLTAALERIRRDRQISLMLDAILQRVNRKWVTGHVQIFEAIRSRAPERAERAMLHHIDSVIDDVQRYRGRPAAPVADGGAVAVAGGGG
jgi:GntR family L-lactate dehydrogenase operon transcriptional regulator